MSTSLRQWLVLCLIAGHAACARDKQRVLTELELESLARATLTDFGIGDACGEFVVFGAEAWNPRTETFDPTGAPIRTRFKVGVGADGGSRCFHIDLVPVELSDAFMTVIAGMTSTGAPGFGQGRRLTIRCLDDDCAVAHHEVLWTR